MNWAPRGKGRRIKPRKSCPEIIRENLRELELTWKYAINRTGMVGENAALDGKEYKVYKVYLWSTTVITKIARAAGKHVPCAVVLYAAPTYLALTLSQKVCNKNCTLVSVCFSYTLI